MLSAAQVVKNSASDGHHHWAAGISVRDVSVAFDDGRPVLEELNLEVAPAEIVALVGASGCGKSTLLRAIAGLIPTSEGRIRLQGVSSRRKGDLAFVFQEATLLPWRTVIENVQLPLELSGRAATGAGGLRQLAAAALQSVGLAGEDHQKFPRELSGGMRMRASIARALVTDPGVMLLDEPFAALDDMLRCRLNDLLLELWTGRGRTILFVTHNIAEAVYLSHRIVILAGGQVGADLPNPLPWPRRPTVRSSVEFAGFYGRVSSTLAEVTRG